MSSWLPLVAVLVAIAVCWGGLAWLLFREPTEPKENP